MVRESLLLVGISCGALGAPGCSSESSAPNAGAGGVGQGAAGAGGVEAGAGGSGADGAGAGNGATGGSAQGGSGGGSGGLEACASLGMRFPEGQWESSAPGDVGLDGTELDEAMAYYASVSGDQGTEQALVIRCGRLVWQGSSIDLAHNVWSVTKSFTSTALGLLVDDGLCSVDTLGQDHVPALATSYAEVTLRHFATMTSGYDGGGDQSDAPFTPSAPLFEPGTEFQYWDSAMNQFGNVLTRIAGEPLEQRFAARIADPIGMDPGEWDWADWGTIDGLVVNGGAGNKARGIHISARQLARFGHLLLNRGTWNAQSLLSSGWVDAATTAQVPASLPSHTPGATGPGVYGYNVWVNGIGPDSERRWPDAPADCYAAVGFNHNRMYVIPSWGLVIVRLGTDGTAPTDSETSTFLGMVAESLVP